MGHKKVCLECKKAFNRDLDFGSEHKYICPECGKEMILLPHRFRPPRQTEMRKWETVKFLIENGFLYHHIYPFDENNKIIFQQGNYVQYPDNLRDAKDFVKMYKAQSKKFKK